MTADLMSRLESGSGDDMVLNIEIARIDPDMEDGMLIPAYTSSLDAALSLVERMLPGWDWYVRHATSADGDVKYGNAQIWRPCDPRDDEAPRYWATHDQPVRALLIALLRALAALTQEGRG